MEKVLLTGGAGFIGSHTLAELLDRDYEVAVRRFGHNARADEHRRRYGAESGGGMRAVRCVARTAPAGHSIIGLGEQRTYRVQRS